MKRLFLLVLLVMVLSSFAFAEMPEPIIQDNSGWEKSLISQEFDNNGDGLPDVFTEFTQINSTLKRFIWR